MDKVAEFSVIKDRFKDTEQIDGGKETRLKVNMRDCMTSQDGNTRNLRRPHIMPLADRVRAGAIRYDDDLRSNGYYDDPKETVKVVESRTDVAVTDKVKEEVSIPPELTAAIKEVWEQTLERYQSLGLDPPPKTASSTKTKPFNGKTPKTEAIDPPTTKLDRFMALDIKIVQSPAVIPGIGDKSLSHLHKNKLNTVIDVIKFYKHCRKNRLEFNFELVKMGIGKQYADACEDAIQQKLDSFQ